MEEGPSYLDTIVHEEPPPRIHMDTEILNAALPFSRRYEDLRNFELEYWKQEVLRAYKGSEQERLNNLEALRRQNFRKACIEAFLAERLAMKDKAKRDGY